LQSITASISLIIAVIAAWISFETFYRQSSAIRPNVIIEIDQSSRYSLIQLTAKNYGQRPAFNVDIVLEKKLINSKGKIISFNKAGIVE
jgi:hypothetical protein